MPHDEPFLMRDPDEAAKEIEPLVHVFGNGVVCDTDSRGYATPDNKDPLELVVNAPGGFIPLWAPNVTLRWRFRPGTLSIFRNPDAAADGITRLFATAVKAWGDAAPIKFTKQDAAWDFEIVVKPFDDCDPNGCVLASAFFPDGGQHELTIYPRMFSQSGDEQQETLEHEIGHTFGLRHFFAKVSETAAPAELFGAQNAFTIMNYGSKSRLTEQDRSDLKSLYELAWSGQLTQINGTPIRFVRPFSSLAPAPDPRFALASGPVG